MIILKIVQYLNLFAVCAMVFIGLHDYGNYIEFKTKSDDEILNIVIWSCVVRTVTYLFTFFYLKSVRDYIRTLEQKINNMQ